MIRITGLFETHLPVADVDRALRFYCEVVGLPLAYTSPERQVAFVWIGGRGQAMLGLWQDRGVQRMQLHFALAVPVEGVLDLPGRLRSAGVAPLDFWGEPTDEPSVIGWMPAACVFCRDPDGHLVEFVTMLSVPPRPDLDVVGWSRWRGAVEM
jgi:lactoylglutathione lyase